VIGSILQGMLDKELVNDDFKSDLGASGSKKEPDPRVKMQMRHQQVKCHLLFENNLLLAESDKIA